MITLKFVKLSDRWFVDIPYIDSNGATYKCDFPKNIDSIWLCNVTKRIFSEFPRAIYITSIKAI